MSIDLPHSPAAERNREPILAVLREHFAHARQMLEVGSGTGQHAVHFAAAMPHLRWQTSDLPENHAGIRAWIDASRLTNVLPPLAFDAADPAHWPDLRFDAAFSANTLHIMGWPEVESLFAHLPRLLAGDATLVVYGPFNIGGQFTSPSNAAFDAQLRAADPKRGLRDLEAVLALAAKAGLDFVADIAMPANNRCVVWKRAKPVL
jgi:SAM-dependent methyltransferase